MSAAQTAWSILTGLLFVVATVLFCAGDLDGAAWTFSAAGGVGYVTLMAMILVDYRRGSSPSV